MTRSRRRIGRTCRSACSRGPISRMSATQKAQPVPDLLLGVDGGNTKTVAIVARADGTVVGTGRAGCADIHNAPSPEAAIAEIARASASALGAAGARGDGLAAAAFSL